MEFQEYRGRYGSCAPCPEGRGFVGMLLYTSESFVYKSDTPEGVYVEFCRLVDELMGPPSLDRLFSR